jgi:hypothetical protein
MMDVLANFMKDAIEPGRGKGEGPLVSDLKPDFMPDG